ncbi:hypothetical protein C2R22_10870 [Salinigranum rubrum]|uniref:Uncharacterized protein n=2 Tax=Salinigranum rubrum TaxID=755307 RepID=A0A2I8VJI6_9EURY|nr:hypothetical protein C2R22_10870 [Salinigranum rubrum]
MVQHIVPPHTPLESNADRRDAVRRRATSALVSTGIVLIALVAVALWTYPVVGSLVLSTFCVGVVLGRRL